MAGVYRIVYRDMLKAYGADAACFMAELLACQKFAEENGKISPDDYFEVSVPQMFEFTGFERRKQYRIIEKLTAAGMIEVKSNGCVRVFKILSAEPVQNGRVKGSKMDGLTRPKWTGKGSKMDGLDVQNGRVPFYIMNSYMISFMNSCCNNDKQRQIIEKVFLYFCSKIPDEKKACDEAAAFIQYNRENYGEDHITGRNYKKHADGWISNMNNKPKKKSKGRSGKTAAEAAKAQGVTVGEFLNIEPLPVNAEKITENTPDIFGELFGGEK